VTLDATLAVEAPDADLAVEAPADDATSVAFEFAVTNTGSDQVTLEFRSGRTAEFVVTPAAVDDAVVWRSSDGRMFTQALRDKVLDPGETLTETATWDEPTRGSYTVVATLDADNVDVTAETSLEV